MEQWRSSSQQKKTIGTIANWFWRLTETGKLRTSLDREGEKIMGALDFRGNESVIVGAHAG
jgi:hypothetical protein